MVGVGGRVLGKVRAGCGPSVSLYQTSIPESIPDWMQVLPQLDTLVKREDHQSWKSTSSEPSVVTWNIINVLRNRRGGFVRERVVEKDVVLKTSVWPPPHQPQREVLIGKKLRRRMWRRSPLPVNPCLSICPGPRTQPRPLGQKQAGVPRVGNG